ncbi:hypothetical protein TNCV_3013791 [Trichonephila clavipes]|nr:hypothetical protein TNCV_3013791 [Trichonephila clavipes]
MIDTLGKVAPVLVVNQFSTAVWTSLASKNQCPFRSLWKAVRSLGCKGNNPEPSNRIAITMFGTPEPHALSCKMIPGQTACHVNGS